MSPLKPPAIPPLFLSPAPPTTSTHKSSMADFYTSHLAAVSERLCLGNLAAIQQPAVLPQNNISHAVIVCNRAALPHAASAEELSLPEVLHWLLADPQLAQAVKSCSSAAVVAKLIPVDLPGLVSVPCSTGYTLLCAFHQTPS